MATEGPTIVALAVHARDVAAEERERFGARCRARLADRGALFLETCHRVEAYLVAEDDPAPLSAWLPDGGRLHVGEAAARHAVSVAVGLDSVALGEDQVLHQLREAVTGARGNGGLDPILERLLTLALRAGRRARSWRQGPAPSLADLALAVIEGRAGPLHGRPLLVVGAGEMGRLAACAATASRAVVSIASRTGGRAEALASEIAARPVPFDPGPTAANFAGIIVALRGRWSIGSSTADAIAASSTVIVDLSVPPAVPGPLAAALGPRFVSSDDLAVGAANGTALGSGPMARFGGLVDSTTVEFLAWLDGHERRAVAQALAERAEHEREAELAKLWRRLPTLDPEARDVIERMSRHLSARLLREPLERLDRDHDGRHERAVRELFGL